MGQVEIKFDREVTVPDSSITDTWKGNNTYLVDKFKSSNYTNPFTGIELFVTPGRVQDDHNLYFNWTVASFEPTKLVLQIVFEKPVYISTGDTRDKLTIKFNNRRLFRDKKLNRPI